MCSAKLEEARSETARARRELALEHRRASQYAARLNAVMRKKDEQARSVTAVASEAAAKELIQMMNTMRDEEAAKHARSKRGAGHEPVPLSARQLAVIGAMRHSWKGYKASAWGKDELHPVSKKFGNSFQLAWSIMDALDTLWLMGLEREFAEAREWVATSFKPKAVDKDINLFENTIRVLGGLLATYALSGDALFLHKAEEMARCMAPAFATPSGIPHSDVNLHTGRAQNKGGGSSTAEVTTLQLEWKWLGEQVSFSSRASGASG